MSAFPPYYPHYNYSLFLTLLCFQLTFSAFVWAGVSETTPAIDPVMQQLLDEDYIAYAGDTCGDDDEDEDGLPYNEILTRYEDARMAFLFGQFEIAYKAWWPLAHDGFAKAQASLAWMYHSGNGVKKDATEAVKWYALAAAQDHKIAQNNLGVMYENGLGVKANTKTAAKWYRKAADIGYANAQYNLAQLYADGRGVPKDIKEAKYWFRVAARQGIKMAAAALAVLENTPLPKIKNSHSLTKPVTHTPYQTNPADKAHSWIENQKNNHYTIQLTRSEDEAWVLKLAAAHQLPQTLVIFKSSDNKNKHWYNLIYGSFPNWKEANDAKKLLPKDLQKWSPWLRRFGEINQSLLK